MRSVIAFILFSILLAACGDKQSSMPSATADAGGIASDARMAKTDAAKPMALFPAGFDLPFEHRVSSQRTEEGGDYLKHRVIVDIDGITLAQADQEIADMAKQRGFDRGDVNRKPNGDFSVMYFVPGAATFRTSFYNAEESATSTASSGNVLHVTWATRRKDGD